MSRKCKTVSFDLGDAIELKLLAHAESKSNFSRYVKRLIERDKSGWYENRVAYNELDVPEDEEVLLVDDVETDGDDLSGYI